MATAHYAFISHLHYGSMSHLAHQFSVRVLDPNRELPVLNELSNTAIEYRCACSVALICQSGPVIRKIVFKYNNISLWLNLACYCKRILKISLCNQKHHQSNELRSNSLVSSFEISVRRFSMNRKFNLTD